MDSSALKAPWAQRYVTAIDAYGAALRSLRHGRLRPSLQKVESALAELYASASEIPDVEPDTSDVPDRTRELEEYRPLQTGLMDRLDGHDVYWEVFDPADPTDAKAIEAVVSNDLVEVLEDVEYARDLLDPSRQIKAADIIWQWRFAFSSHWGRHAASALRVVNSLVHAQFADDFKENEGYPDA